MAYSIEILNNIRDNASEEYKSRIPEATQTNIATIGQAFKTYTLLYNEFASALVNKIGKTLIEQKMFKNRLAKYKSGEIIDAQDVEDIFVEMAKAEGKYDPQGTNPLGRRDALDVKVYYHRENRQDCYAISIGDIDFRKVFTSPATLDTFIKGQINAVYSGDAYDEYLCMKNVLSTYKGENGRCGYFEYAVPYYEEIDNKTEWAKTFVKTLRKAVLDLTLEPSTQYNVAGVKTWCEPDNMTLFIHKDVAVECDVELLAKAFHQSNTDLKVVPDIVIMDNFGDDVEMQKAYAILVDRDFLKVWDTLSHMEPQRNAQGLFTNYFYHHHQILSASKFKNAVVLMGMPTGLYG